MEIILTAGILSLLFAIIENPSINPPEADKLWG